MEADTCSIAPKKKGEKMALGDFLGNQCTHIHTHLAATLENACVCMARHTAKGRHTDSDTQLSDHGQTKWTRSQSHRHHLDMAVHASAAMTDRASGADSTSQTGAALAQMHADHQAEWVGVWGIEAPATVRVLRTRGTKKAF